MILPKSRTVLSLTCLTLLTACGGKEKYLEPTGKAAFVPESTVEFSQYVHNSRKNIENILNEVRPNENKESYLGKYTNEEAAAMRSPFQVESDRSQCNGMSKGNEKGFLLIHGLTDSPYLMSSISDSLAKEYPCSLIRAVLLPGHGTVVGDSLNMHNEDWKKIVQYGVDSFKHVDRVTDLYVAGFSTGTSLAIDYMQQNPSQRGTDRDDKIKGMILLSTAVKAKSKFACLSPLVSYVKDWMSVFHERDAARYESFSYNAGAEFYDLTKDMANPEYALDIPVLMAVSADDATVDARAAREFFCYSKNVKRRALIWYQSFYPEINAEINSKDTPELMCENIVEVRPKDLDPQYKTLNIAHTAISIRPEDAHYGINGKYHNCKKYDSEKTMDQFYACQSNTSDYFFGEKNLEDSEGRYFRRGTFNPDYKNLEARILCFVNVNCPMNALLQVK
ncbi:esterase [Candidatus Electrothrix aarhusensis]